MTPLDFKLALTRIRYRDDKRTVTTDGLIVSREFIGAAEVWALRGRSPVSYHETRAEAELVALTGGAR